MALASITIFSVGEKVPSLSIFANVYSLSLQNDFSSISQVSFRHCYITNFCSLSIPR